MPVEFLSDEQAARYGRYAGEPSREQLDRYFLLDEADREALAAKRGGHNRLGYALQLATARFLGAMPDPLEAPDGVLVHLAAQLGLPPDREDLGRYASGETRWDHAAEIRRRHGYRELADAPAERIGLLRFLYARARVAAEGPSVLFDLATARLVERRVLLPGASVLARLVAAVRARAEERLWRELAAVPDARQREALEGLLEVPDGSRSSRLDRLRRAPTSATAAGLVGALERLEAVRALGVGRADVSRVPAGRVAALARYGLEAKAQALARMRPGRRVATLLVTTQRLEADALDDALDVLCQLVGTLDNRAERDGQRGRLEAYPSLGRAALTARAAVLAALQPGHDTLEALLGAMFAAAPREELLAAAEAIARLTRPPEDARAEDLVRRYGYVRQFLPKLLATVALDATPAGRPTLEAYNALPRLEGRRRVDADEVPLEVAQGAWRSLVLRGGDLERPAYTLCVLERLREDLRRREVFAPGSRRWADPRARLLDGPVWEAERPGVCRALGLPADATTFLEGLASQLDAAYRGVAARLAANPGARIGPAKGKAGDRPSLDALEPLEEPESLRALRSAVAALMPRVDLPELLLEVDAWTGFTGAFAHLSEAAARLEGLATSVAAVLVAEACNVGLEPVVRADDPALTRSRLSHVDQNYVRAETISEANARLVDFQASVPLARAWGGGELASADGLRFRVPVRTINAGPNPRYFGPGRGVTYLNFVSDQATGFHAIVVPGTLRDSLHILDGLLEQNTGLEPTQVTSDTHGYTDVVFGLFRLLGFQFSPRLAGLPDRTFWRFDKEADYGPLDGLARHRLSAALVERHYDDMLRVAGSLATGRVRASDILRVLQGNGRPTALGRAIGEVGRAAKTMHLLAYLDDEGYRRRIGAQLNLHEARHALARAVFHGKRGELRQRYREGQEDQLGALGLVVNAAVLWNTRYIGAALERLRSEGLEVREEDVGRLSPLGHEHVNLLGRYQFALDGRLGSGWLRPLREPGEGEG